MVLFLFVLMLLNLHDDELGVSRASVSKLLGLWGAATVAVIAGASVVAYHQGSATVTADSLAADFGSVHGIGRALMTTHLLPFELVSILLLVGIVSAVVVAKRRL
jgi:NADH-quinone oxidoreductase subunit J